MWQICNESTKYRSSLGLVGRYRQIDKQLLYVVRGLKNCKRLESEVELAFLHVTRR
jgi:hypothetical protein